MEFAGFQRSRFVKLGWSQVIPTPSKPMQASSIFVC